LWWIGFREPIKRIASTAFHHFPFEALGEAPAMSRPKQVFQRINSWKRFNYRFMKLITGTLPNGVDPAWLEDTCPVSFDEWAKLTMSLASDFPGASAALVEYKKTFRKAVQSSKVTSDWEDARSIAEDLLNLELSRRPATGKRRNLLEIDKAREAKVLRAIKEKGIYAKPEAIRKAAGIGRNPCLKILRKLEAEGKYKEFEKRPRSPSIST
jgi:hypothetical protein